MKKKSSISIACASAFWGDTAQATKQILAEPKLDYIVYDYLSEVTLTLLAKQREKDPKSGFITEFVKDVIEPHLNEIVKRGIKLVCNAGGMNPEALRAQILEVAEKQGVKVRIGCVSGDNLIGSSALPAEIQDFEGRKRLSRSLATANAYFGAEPVARALVAGVDIVVTGRIVDSALVVGPLLAEFDLQNKNFDWLAQASLAGHLLECGTQVTGGNFTDWKSVPHPENMGFPITEFFDDGHFEIFKPAGTGGLITAASVAEQLVYEIGDPAAYMLPDVVCDFTSVTLTQKASDRIHVEGAKGSAPSNQYKVSATCFEGFKVATTAYIAGGTGALERAKAIGATILRRCRQILKAQGFEDFTEVLQDELGTDSQVILRIAAAHPKKQALEILANEIAPAATSLAPGVASLLGGRAQVMPRIALVSFLIDKKSVTAQVNEGSETLPPLDFKFAPAQKKPTPSKTTSTSKTGGKMVQIPLAQIAYARSGDKGGDANVGVIARKPEHYSLLQQTVTAKAVAKHFATKFDSPNDMQVLSWELPGIHALNFLVKNSLGGGGVFSLRLDPQGKTYGQELLTMKVSVPEDVL